MKSVLVAGLVALFGVCAQAFEFPEAMLGHYTVVENLECDLNKIPTKLEECVANDSANFILGQLLILKFEVDGKTGYTFAEWLPHSGDQFIFQDINGTDPDGVKFFKKVESLTPEGFHFVKGEETPKGLSRTDHYILQKAGSEWIYTQASQGNDFGGPFEYYRKFRVRRLDGPSL